MGVRTYPDQPRIYIDMDGVVADFDLMIRETLTPAQTLKHECGIYLRLKPVAGALEAVALLDKKGHEIFFLTKIPSKNHHAATEKLQWISAYFPKYNDRVIISSDKGCVGTSRDYLIDDHPEWANANNFPGTIIHFKNNWEEIIQKHF